MQLNRNHYFMLGTVILLLGLQFRYVDRYTLTADTTRYIEKKLGTPRPTTVEPVAAILAGTELSPSQRTVSVPRWLGLSLISVGAVLVLHSWAMKKPGS
jgi:hypothetical protein